MSYLPLIFFFQLYNLSFFWRQDPEYTAFYMYILPSQALCSLVCWRWTSYRASHWLQASSFPSFLFLFFFPLRRKCLSGEASEPQVCSLMPLAWLFSASQTAPCCSSLTYLRAANFIDALTFMGLMWNEKYSEKWTIFTGLWNLLSEQSTGDYNIWSLFSNLFSS